MVRVRAPTSVMWPSGSWCISTRPASHARRRDVSYETGFASGRLLREQDLVAELFEAPDVVATGALRVASGEVIGPEILVGHAVLEHVPQGYEHRVLHGHNRRFGSLRALSRWKSAR